MILLNDLARHTASNADAIAASVERVTRSGWFILGAECRAFEAEFAAYCGVDHCIGLGNGTDAIELALRALGVQHGSRVATVANAGFYTTAALQLIGATPLFIDVDEKSCLMDLADLEATLVRERPAAIVITHLYGLLHDMDRVMELARRAGIPVLEDCAQAHGASRNGRMAGTFADAGVFSFYPTKNLGALGDAGAVVTTRPELAEQVRQLRQYGWTSKYRVHTLGGRNSRMDELQAAILRSKLPRLNGWNARRRQIAEHYTASFRSTGIGCPDSFGTHYVAHLYVIRTKSRDRVQERLKNAHIATEVHYPVPDTKQPCWTAPEQWPQLPVTERLASEILSLPCYPELTDQEVETVIAAVLET